MNQKDVISLMKEERSSNNLIFFILFFSKSDKYLELDCFSPEETSTAIYYRLMVI